MNHRLPALDWLRGIVMVLMVTDHASKAYNGGRLITDSTFFYDPNNALPAAQFLYRWMSHLCAPSFVFLAGTALALSIARKQERGVPARSIDRDLLIRGALILVLEVVFINLFWVPGALLLQVLYAIGASMIFMILLRRLPTAWLVGGALLVLVLGEWVVTHGAGLDRPFREIAGFTFITGMYSDVLVAYPFVPWLAIMVLGWGFGHYLIRYRTEHHTEHRTEQSRTWSPATWLGICGAAGIVLFAVLRGLDGFGNMLLWRYDNSLVQWLHVSKYPPSLSFVALELGLMAILLALLFVVQDRRGNRPAAQGPLLIFGQTALFFYLAHIAMLELSVRALSMHQAAGLGTACVASAIVIVVLFPLCKAYRGYKSAHPDSWVRYI
jgi:uncharacterized membrane protein